MKILALITTASLLALANTALVSTAQAATEVELKDIAAKVVVQPENRSDVQLKVVYGKVKLPAIMVHTKGDTFVADGKLKKRGLNCKDGQSIEVAGVGTILIDPSEGDMAEYLASLLTATKRDKDRTAIYLNECRQMGIEVLVPDVNESESDFIVRDGRIRFGLSAVRNVGEGVVEKIYLRGGLSWCSRHELVKEAALDRDAASI